MELKLSCARSLPAMRVGVFGFALGQVANDMQRCVHPVDGKSNRVRKFRIEDEKLGNAKRADRGGVSLAIRFERHAGAQQTNPFEIFGAFYHLVGGRVGGHICALEMRFHQAGERVGALDVTPELNVLPAFAMAHRAVGDALKKVSAFLDGAEEAVGLRASTILRGAHPGASPSRRDRGD